MNEESGIWGVSMNQGLTDCQIGICLLFKIQKKITWLDLPR